MVKYNLPSACGDCGTTHDYSTCPEEMLFNISYLTYKRTHSLKMYSKLRDCLLRNFSRLPDSMATDIMLDYMETL